MSTVLGHTGRAMVRYRGSVAFLLAIVGTQILVALALPWPLKLVVDNVLGDAPSTRRAKRPAAPSNTRSRT